MAEADEQPTTPTPTQDTPATPVADAGQAPAPAKRQRAKATEATEATEAPQDAPAGQQAAEGAAPTTDEGETEQEPPAPPERVWRVALDLHTYLLGAEVTEVQVGVVRADPPGNPGGVVGLYSSDGMRLMQALSVVLHGDIKARMAVGPILDQYGFTLLGSGPDLEHARRVVYLHTTLLA